MNAILLKLEQSQVFDKIDRAIPVIVSLCSGYFVASWLISVF